MPSSATRPASLSDEDLKRLMRLMKGADTAELKVTVPDSALRSTVMSLGMDPLDAQIRQVFFFDTPDLALNKVGVVPRARRVQGKGGDTVVKLRPVVPEDLSADLRDSPRFGVEVDAMPGGFVCSASFKGVCGIDKPREVAAGTRAISTLFSKKQRDFFSDHAPDHIGLDDLSVLGPIFVLKVKNSPKGFGRRLVAEVWLYPDGSRILELSIKCAPGEAFQVAAEVRAFLSERDVKISSEPLTKTKTALEYFSKSLKGSGVGAPRAEQHATSPTKSN